MLTQHTAVDGCGKIIYIDFIETRPRSMLLDVSLSKSLRGRPALLKLAFPARRWTCLEKAKCMCCSWHELDARRCGVTCLSGPLPVSECSVRSHRDLLAVGMITSNSVSYFVRFFTVFVSEIFVVNNFRNFQMEGNSAYNYREQGVSSEKKCYACGKNVPVRRKTLLLFLSAGTPAKFRPEVNIPFLSEPPTIIHFRAY